MKILIIVLVAVATVALLLGVFDYLLCRGSSERSAFSRIRSVLFRASDAKKYPEIYLRLRAEFEKFSDVSDDTCLLILPTKENNYTDVELGYYATKRSFTLTAMGEMPDELKGLDEVLEALCKCPYKDLVEFAFFERVCELQKGTGRKETEDAKRTLDNWLNQNDD